MLKRRAVSALKHLNLGFEQVFQLRFFGPANDAGPEDADVVWVSKTAYFFGRDSGGTMPLLR